MKLFASLVPCLFVLACGGGGKPAPLPPEDPIDEEPGEDVEPEEEEEPEPPPPPPPPLVWQAHVELAPVKGSKLKPTVVWFAQTEGEVARLTSDGFPGLKAGTYHLVFHESGECGKNASKVGPAWDLAADAAFTVKIAKGDPGALDQSLELMLDGDDSIIGRTLVVHADKKGKPDKAQGCGVIYADEVTAEEGGEDEALDE